LSELIGPKIFNNPKPTKLIRHLLNIGAQDKDSIVLDFFAGSGTTGHAVLSQNQEDGGRRTFVLIQLPEATGRADYPTITHIAKERLRRVIDTATPRHTSLAPDPGHNLGFRSFQLAPSNFQPWNADTISDLTQLERQLERHIRHVRPDRTPEDLMFEILLTEGYAPTTRVETISVHGKEIFSAADGSFLICLDRALTLDVIRAMADGSPQRVVCLDEGFAGNDQLKANALQIFKSKGTVFRTI
jgi:adenine-specific DNA-methyltransferase